MRWAKGGEAWTAKRMAECVRKVQVTGNWFIIVTHQLDKLSRNK